jgi:alpha-L-fucosidase
VREAQIVSLALSKAVIERVTILDSRELLKFRQTPEALVVSLPEMTAPSKMPYVLRIEGNLPLGTA